MSTYDPETRNPASGGKPRQGDRGEFSWYAFLFGPPFKLIGFFYRIYNTNRVRLAGLASKPRVSSGLRKVMVLTLLLWIVIWLLASDDSRNRLTDAVKENFGALGTELQD